MKGLVSEVGSSILRWALLNDHQRYLMTKRLGD
jgi:hypothetical protein